MNRQKPRRTNRCRRIVPRSGGRLIGQVAVLAAASSPHGTDDENRIIAAASVLVRKK